MIGPREEALNEALAIVLKHTELLEETSKSGGTNRLLASISDTEDGSDNYKIGVQVLSDSMLQEVVGQLDESLREPFRNKLDLAVEQTPKGAYVVVFGAYLNGIYEMGVISVFPSKALSLVPPINSRGGSA